MIEQLKIYFDMFELCVVIILSEIIIQKMICEQQFLVFCYFGGCCVGWLVKEVLEWVENCLVLDFVLLFNIGVKKFGCCQQ